MSATSTTPVRVLGRPKRTDPSSCTILSYKVFAKGNSAQRHEGKMMMNEDPMRRPTTGQPAAIPGSGPPASEGPATGMPQLPIGAPIPAAAPATRPQPRIWPGMNPEQLQAYIEGTMKRRSRKKPRPSLDKHRDFLLACVKGKAVMQQVFDDLVAIDPAVRDDFGPDGYRAFNACVKRMAQE